MSDHEEKVRRAIKTWSQAGPPSSEVTVRVMAKVRRARQRRAVLAGTVVVAGLAMLVQLSGLAGGRGTAVRVAANHGRGHAGHPSSARGTTSTIRGAGPASTSTTAQSRGSASQQPSSPAATQARAPVPPQGTARVTYQPFHGSQLAAGLHVTAHQSGSCFRYGAPSRSYYRCFGVSNYIFDPCFAGPQGTSSPLVCPEDPISGTVALFQVTAPPPAGTTPSPTAVSRPWAMELSNGQLCLMVSAAWSGLGPYSCQPPAGGQGAVPPGAAVADCHSPVPSKTWWSAECQAKLSASSSFSPLTVKTVWY